MQYMSSVVPALSKQIRTRHPARRAPDCGTSPRHHGPFGSAAYSISCDTTGHTHYIFFDPVIVQPESDTEGFMIVALQLQYVLPGVDR